MPSMPQENRHFRLVKLLAIPDRRETDGARSVAVWCEVTDLDGWIGLACLVLIVLECVALLICRR